MKQLYKIDENDNVRIWFIELEGPNYRTHSGVLEGKIVISGWKAAKPKNEGKKNGTTAEEQAQLEVERKYRDQLDTGGYFETIEDARIGARSYFLPMLAHKWKENKHRVKFPVYSQPKLDGARCLVQKDSIKTREGKVFVSVPHIQAALKPIFDTYPNLVFDGELYNHELKNDFEKLISLIRKTKPTEADIAESAEKIQYWIYDVYDRDNPNAEFDSRVDYLSCIFKNISPIIIVPTHRCDNEVQLDSLFAEYLEDGYEGQMVRLPYSVYEQKRSRNLLKRKEFEDAEFEIDHIEEGVGNWAGYAKKVFIKLENGDIQKSGIRGTMPFLKKVLEEAEEYKGTKATVRFQGRTADGKLRFPVITYLWKGERDL